MTSRKRGMILQAVAAVKRGRLLILALVILTLAQLTLTLTLTRTQTLRLIQISLGMVDRVAGLVTVVGRGLVGTRAVERLGEDRRRRTL